MNFNYNKIRKKNYPYIIAEIGVNHGCSLKIAKKMILQAKKGGAHAVKFQTYKAEKIAKKDSRAYWDTSKEKTKSQFELFSKYDKFENNDYRQLATYCKNKKIDFLSTPFDIDAVDKLKNLVPVFKISSSDITNYPLLYKISKTKKPIILSSGASNLEEIKSAIKILKKGTNKIIIMHCILNYPTKYNNANLNMILSLKSEFPDYIIGYSDHTLPNADMTVLTTAYLLGAKVMEKHFTYNKKMKGNDHYHSMDTKDLLSLSKNLKKILIILGKKRKKNFIKSELKSRKFARRSIVITRDIKKNTIIKEKDLITLRPNIGIPANLWSKVIGKRTKKNLRANKTMSWRDLK